MSKEPRRNTTSNQETQKAVSNHQNGTLKRNRPVINLRLPGKVTAPAFLHGSPFVDIARRPLLRGRAIGDIPICQSGGILTLVRGCYVPLLHMLGGAVVAASRYLEHGQGRFACAGAVFPRNTVSQLKRACPNAKESHGSLYCNTRFGMWTVPRKRARSCIAIYARLSSD